jgi:hypothetical protein
VELMFPRIVTFVYLSEASFKRPFALSAECGA